MLFFLALLLVWCVVSVFAETMEMSTYYPAATNITNVDRFHANRESVGNAYNPTNVPDANLPDGYLVVANRVGIGLANPSVRLEIRSQPTFGDPALILSSPDFISLRLDRAAATNDALVRFATAGTDQWLVGTGRAGDNENFSFFALGASRLTVTQAGNVGIGVDAPATSLSLNGEAVRTISMERRTANNADGLGLLVRAGGGSAGGNNRNGGTASVSGGIATGNGSSSVVFQTATAGAGGNADRIPTTKMTINGAGLVGVNVAPSVNRLEVIHAGPDGTFAIRADNTVGQAIYAQGSTIGVQGVGASYGGQFTASAAGSIGLLAFSSGANSYGTFSQGQYTGLFSMSNQNQDTYGSISYGGIVGVYGYATRNSSYGGQFYGTTYGSMSYALGNGGTTYGSLHYGRNGIFAQGTGNGQTGIGVQANGNRYDFDAIGPGIDFHGASSVRWKRNITLIDDPLGKLRRLRGVYFNWDEAHGGRRDVGAIAEEVGKVLPEIVAYEENGVDATGLDYGKLTPLLIEAVKELTLKVEALEAEVKRLKEEQGETRI